MKRSVTDILNEWFYRLPNGYAIPPYNDMELQVLSKILTENSIDPKPILESLRGDTRPAEKLKRPSINATDLKEGLVCIAIQTFENHKNIIYKIADQLSRPSSDQSMKEILGEKALSPFLNDAMLAADEPSYRMKGGSQWLNWFFNTPISQAKTSKKTFMNGFSAGNAILNTGEFKFPPSATVNRGTDLDDIKKYASKAIENGWQGDAKLEFGPDRWNPSDIMIFKEGRIPSYKKLAAPGAPTMEGQESLNGIFHNEPGSDREIIGISLKESNAQGGKATQLVKTINPNDQWPEGVTAEISKEQKDQLRTLYLVTKEAGQKVPAIAKYGDHTGPYSQEVGMNITPKVFKNNRGEEYYSKKWTESTRELQNSLKTDKLAESLFGSEINEKWFNVAVHAKYKQTVRQTLIKEYTAQRSSFASNLKKYTSINFQDKSNEINDLSEINMMRKLTVAKYFNYVIANFNTGDFKGTVLKQLAVASGPLVALTMMAVGQSGASPTFYKTYGSPKSLDGGKVEIFHGDGELRLSEDNDLILNDSLDYGGYNIAYNVDVFNGNTKHSTHATQLDLRFDKWSLRVEIGKYSQI